MLDVADQLFGPGLGVVPEEGHSKQDRKSTLMTEGDSDGSEFLSGEEDDSVSSNELNEMTKAMKRTEGRAQTEQRVPIQSLCNLPVDSVKPFSTEKRTPQNIKDMTKNRLSFGLGNSSLQNLIPAHKPHKKTGLSSITNLNSNNETMDPNNNTMSLNNNLMSPNNERTSKVSMQHPTDTKSPGHRTTKSTSVYDEKSPRKEYRISPTKVHPFSPPESPTKVREYGPVG